MDFTRDSLASGRKFHTLDITRRRSSWHKPPRDQPLPHAGRAYKTGVGSIKLAGVPERYIMTGPIKESRSCLLPRNKLDMLGMRFRCLYATNSAR